jgi:5-methylcytosine-specific restriction endonuclease McrA
MRHHNRSAHAVIFALLIFEIQRNRQHVRRIERTRPATGAGHSQTKKATILERDGHKCYLCGQPLTLEIAVFDHIIPRSRNGTNRMGNLGAACWACDYFKGDRLLCELTWPG